MRTLVILLSLALFFLTGLVIGMDRTHKENDGHLTVEENVEQTEEERVMIEQQTTERKALQADEPEHFTQKAASFLESGVKGFYELVVGVTYQLVQVFF